METTSQNVCALISFICGIIGIMFGVIPLFGWLFAPLWIIAIVCGIFGREQLRHKILANIGLILGIVIVIYKIGFWIWIIVVEPTFS